MELSYSLSNNLKESISKIDYLRARLHLEPLTVKEEFRMRWEAMILRIYYALSLTGNQFLKNDIIKTLTNPGKNMSREKQEIIRYREALNRIFWEHLGSTKTVSVRSILDLYGIMHSGRLNFAENKVKNLLDYLQASPEHPVIQAGIAHAEFLLLAPFASWNERMSHLLTLLFLYKRGYDFRGLLVLEEYFRKNLTLYREKLKNVARTGSLTLWLEFFAESLISQLEKVISNFESIEYKTSLPSSFFELNDRQKEILSLLEEPGSKITNKKVQNMFHISQITASRDLAHLKTLGLLISHGKGRSVYYTRTR